LEFSLLISMLNLTCECKNWSCHSCVVSWLCCSLNVSVLMMYVLMQEESAPVSPSLFHSSVSVSEDDMSGDGEPNAGKVYVL